MTWRVRDLLRRTRRQALAIREHPLDGREVAPRALCHKVGGEGRQLKEGRHTLQHVKGLQHNLGSQAGKLLQASG